ncbi:acrylyl-CoA reductase (NADPH) [Homoserinimonas sp. A447]
MRAWMVTKGGDGVDSQLVNVTDADLADRTESADGDVLVDVEYSSINYKDGLALAGRPGVIREHPLIPGIDLVGTVAESSDDRWRAGDQVLLNGWGIGETHNGGLAERARVSGDWLVRLPERLSARQAAAIGTAGFTAMLAVMELERADALGSRATDGKVLVTGAAGGVGSIATALLAGLGHTVVCSTGRQEQHEYLRRLGATEIIDRNSLSEPGKPLQGERWSGAIDSVGGTTLANVLAQTRYGGAVASCGLAASHELPATVLPFILRGVRLIGINSVFAPAAIRQEAWSRLATDLDLGLLDDLTETVGLADARRIADDILAGRIRGRTVVDVRT